LLPSLKRYSLNNSLHRPGSRLGRITFSVKNIALFFLCYYLLTYAFLLARSIGHRLRNTPFSVSGHLLHFSPGVSHLLCFVFSVSLCQVFRGLPLLLFPGGFHVMASRVIGSAGFLSLCPIYLHFLFFISFSMGSCLVVFQSVTLDTLSVHFRRWHLLMKVCILVSVFCVVRHVSVT